MARIVFLYDRFYPEIGGIERKIAELGRELSVEHHVRVIAKSRPGLRGVHQHEGMSVFRCRPWSRRVDQALAGADLVYGFGYTPFSPRCLFPLAVARRAARKGVRLAWCPTFYPVPASAPAAGIARPLWKKILPDSVRRAVRSRLDRAYRDVFERCSIIHALRDAEQDHWRRRFPHLDVRLMPDGVSRGHLGCTEKRAAEATLTTRFGPGPHIASMGRMTEVKNQEVVVRAMGTVLKEFPTARLLLVGPDREGVGPRLRRLADRPEYAGAVTLTGPLPDREVCALYAGCACVVHPSRHEASGLTPLEALAHGTPVVHSGRGGLEFFGSFPGCEVVRNLDDPEPWAAAMLGVLRNRMAAEGRAREGRVRVFARHTWEPVTQSIAEQVEVAGRITPEASQANADRDGRHRRLAGGRRGRRHRIAFIGGRGVGAPYSGIETFYEEVGSRLAARGHDVTVYCRRHFTPPGEAYRGMRIVRLPTLRSKHLETIVHSFLATVHAMPSGYDLVHIHAIGSAVFAFLPRLVGCPTVVTVHALDWARPKWKRLARWCLRGAEWAGVAFPNRTTAVSASVADHLRARFGALVEVLPNGVNVCPPAAPNLIRKMGIHPGRYVLFAGRLSEEKRCHQLLEAFRRAATDGQQLIFAGAALYAPDYERRLRSLAGPNVRFLGSVDRQALAELYTNCALFVLPSSLEGLSVALLEAMSYGAPVLVSDIPPNVEAVGDTGFLFREGDTDDLARQLSSLLANPDGLRAAGRAARRRVVEQFTWDSVVGRLEDLYDSVLGASTTSIRSRAT